jgi:signal transduction histidine kinase
MRRRATEERLRIARELHDVVAHNMSLISLQAGVALHLIDQQPEQARESLSTIKDASKEALVELRSILGVLRQVDEPDPAQGRTGGVDGAADGIETEVAGRGVLGTADEAGAPRSPVPSLRRLGTLLERSRAAGLDVTVDDDVYVHLAEFSRDVDLAAYRIIQESLTNVARYADNPSATVRLRVEDGELSVAVLDEGSSPPTGEVVASSGHGITGMRERAASVGGRFEAGPRPGRGFAVRAWLPLAGRAQVGER